MLLFNNDTSDIDQSIEMVRFQCGPDSRDACRIKMVLKQEGTDLWKKMKY